MLARKADPATVLVKIVNGTSTKTSKLQGDVYGLINPPSGPFRYFMVLVDAFGTHFEVSFLSTRNMVFPKLLAMLLKF